MGGIWGEVTGRTKIATWKAFEQKTAHAGLRTREQQDEQGMYLQFPTNKREAYRRMEPASNGLGWILRYHFHS